MTIIKLSPRAYRHALDWLGDAWLGFTVAYPGDVANFYVHVLRAFSREGGST